MADREIRRKQIITVVILAVIVILCGFRISKLITGAGQEDYRGLNLDKYIEVGDYSQLKPEVKTDDPNTLEDQIWTALLQRAEVKKYPKKQVKAYMKENQAQYEKLASDHGYASLDAYVKKELGVEIEEFEEQLKTYAESRVKSDLTVCAVAKKEGITISDEEYAERLEGILKDSGLDRTGFEELFGMSLEKYAEENHMRLRFLQEKVIQVMIENTGKE